MRYSLAASTSQCTYGMCDFTSYCNSNPKSCTIFSCFCPTPTNLDAEFKCYSKSYKLYYFLHCL